MQKIKPKEVLYIKLGIGSEWNRECIKKGIAKIGFNEIDIRDIKNRNWNKIHDLYSKKYSNLAASLYANQIKKFFLANTETIWITFDAQNLWWCQLKGELHENADKTKYRKTINGWSSKSIKGSQLFKDDLSGTLLAVQGYRSTICNVQDAEYVINKINAEELLEIKNIEKDLCQLTESVAALIKRLKPADFELLVDLIFRDMGCQRIGKVGGTQKTKDIELIAPATKERYLVQVKSKTELSEFLNYEKRFIDLENYSKYFYVYHSTKDKKMEALKNDMEAGIIIWRIREIAEHTINSGLIDWLKKKVG